MGRKIIRFESDLLSGQNANARYRVRMRPQGWTWNRETGLPYKGQDLWNVVVNGIYPVFDQLSDRLNPQLYYQAWPD